MGKLLSMMTHECPMIVGRDLETHEPVTCGRTILRKYRMCLPCDFRLQRDKRKERDEEERND